MVVRFVFSVAQGVGCNKDEIRVVYLIVRGGGRLENGRAREIPRRKYERGNSVGFCGVGKGSVV